jgi:hypothetical protein
MLSHHQSTDPNLSVPRPSRPLTASPLTFTAQPWVVLRDSQKQPQGSNVRRWPASEFELFSPFLFLWRVHSPISHKQPPHRMH